MTIKLGNEEDKKWILDTYPYTRQVLYEGGILIVAVDDEKKINGFSWAFRRYIPIESEYIEDFINVIEVFDKSKRCKGIGSLLIQKHIEVARENGCYQVRAYFDAGNMASQKLWLKNKFTISPIKNEQDQVLGSYAAYKI